jgi:transcriptional regulator with XRE-family HTH domain
MWNNEINGRYPFPEVEKMPRVKIGSNDRTVNTTFGTRLKKFRRTVKVTQEELARRTKLSRQTITNIEAGRQGITVSRMMTISKALGIEPKMWFSPASEWISFVMETFDEEERKRNEIQTTR